MIGMTEVVVIVLFIGAIYFFGNQKMSEWIKAFKTAKKEFNETLKEEK